MSTWSKVSAATPRAVRASSLGRSSGRPISGTSKRQAAILMPAMSPLMAEGTIRRWRKKEGESFEAGDVLLEIESDIATIDVEACSSGILGKIISPDGTRKVPIEQVIALVARDMDEYAVLQSSTLHAQDTMLRAPRLSPAPGPSSSSTSSSGRSDSTMPMSSSRTPTPAPRRLSLFEQQMQRSGHRHAHVGGPLSNSMSSQSSRLPVEESPCPPPRIASRLRKDSFSPVKHDSDLSAEADQSVLADSVAMRRRIVHQLSMSSFASRDDLDPFL